MTDPPRPRVVLLTERWDEGDAEPEEAVRRVAGALARSADVDIVTTQGTVPRHCFDGVFPLHELASAPPAPVRIRRRLLLDALTGPSALGQGPDGRSCPPQATEWLDAVDRAAWAPARALIAGLRPDLLVVTGAVHGGLPDLLDEAAPGVPVVVLPLAPDAPTLALPPARDLLDSADGILVLTEAEHRDVMTGFGPGPHPPVHTVGLALATNPAVWREPMTALSGQDYVLVLCDSDPDAPVAPFEAAVDLLASALPDNSVAAVFTDRLDIWRRGELESLPPPVKLTDRCRLMAWARSTVDLAPGRLWARQSARSLLYATPIVVPDHSRAREHAELGNGGLWYRGMDEMVGAVRALLDPDVRESLGTQGRAYAEERFGSSDRFVARLGAALPQLTPAG